MEVNIFALIGMFGALCGICFGYLGYTNGLKKECKTESSDNGAMKTDVRYLVKRVDEILLEQKDTNKSISELADRVTRTEESLKSLHKRVDGLEGK